MAKNLLPPAEQIGDVAGQPTLPDQFYDVDQTTLVTAFPIINTGITALAELVKANENARSGQATNRAAKRQFKNNNTLGEAGRGFIFAGAHVIAQNEDPAIGIRAGEAVLAQLPDGLGHPSSQAPARTTGKKDDKEQEKDNFHTLWTKRSVPIAAPLRHLHIVSGLVSAELDAISPSDPDTSYLLLKAMATDPSRKHFETKLDAISNWQPSHATVAMAGIARSTIHKRLTAQLLRGEFDGHIAHDIVRFADTDRPLDPSFAKIRQLGRFGIAFADQAPHDKAAFYERMAETLAEWPAAERQVVLDARQTILGATETNIKRMDGWLRNFSFVADEGQNALAVFSDAIDTLILEWLKRENLSGPERARMIRASQLRGLHKRKLVLNRDRRDARKHTKDEPVAEVVQDEEDNRTPPTLVTFNLNDNTSTEGVEGLIDAFVDKVSQGKTRIRAELVKVTEYLLRTDSPLATRHGVVPLVNVSVTLGPGERPRRVFQLKPADAHNLATSNKVNGSRVFFVRMPGNVITVIGIEPIERQDAFLRRLRNRAKRSQESSDQDNDVDD